MYERTKCEAEKLVLESYKNWNPPVTIIRPDFVYGPGDLRRLPLYRTIRDKRFLIVGNGKSFLHPTYIDDVIHGFHLVTSNPVAFGQIYNLAGPALVTAEDYVKTIAQLLKVSPPRFSIPKTVALAVAWASEAFSKINAKEPFITRSKVEFLTDNHGSDTSKAESQLGYRPRVEFQDGMRQTIDWYHDRRLL